MKVGYLDAELMAELDRCWVQGQFVGFRPEVELIAPATALVAAVAAHGDVHGERSPMLGRGLVQRTVSVPLLALRMNGLEP